MWKNPLPAFTVIGYCEGISFLVLLGIAMPLKYFAGLPEVVLAVGWVHGLLWMLYITAALRFARVLKWTILTLFCAGIASITPFGPFVFDSCIRRKAPVVTSDARG